jgi:hypothetical protein
MPKQSDDLSREGEVSQETSKARLRIPVPKREEFLGLLNQAAKRRSEEAHPSQSDQGKPQPSPARSVTVVVPEGILV